MRRSRSVERVRRLMSDGRWHTLRELSESSGYKETGVSARIRDLRREEYGGCRVATRRVNRSLWEYRLEGSDDAS